MQKHLGLHLHLEINWQICPQLKTENFAGGERNLVERCKHYICKQCVMYTNGRWSVKPALATFFKWTICEKVVCVVCDGREKAGSNLVFLFHAITTLSYDSDHTSVLQASDIRLLMAQLKPVNWIYLQRFSMPPSIDVWKKVNCENAALSFFSRLIIAKALPAQHLE